MNRNLIDKYNIFHSSYKILGEFYDAQENAHNSLQNYLYTQQEHESQLYKTYLEEATQNLNEIKTVLMGDEGNWRFQLLENMTASYREQAEKVCLLRVIHDEAYNTEYDTLLKINEGIMQTSDSYYDLVTTSMESTLKEIDEIQYQTEIIFYCFVVFCVAGILLYTVIILKSITAPIDRLVDNMEDIRAGVFDFHCIPVKSQEIKVLCLALQDLSDHIHKNIEAEKEKIALHNQLLIKENENLRKDELLISSELKMLQNQINPHFLFNAMNMIYQQAIRDHADPTVQMVEKMTECMRYTLTQKARTSTLHMEVNFVENYLFIQNKRFVDRIRFELQVQEPIPNIKIPAMIIEPLIDNSLKHGLVNTSQNGSVIITVKSDDAFVYISVSDNGKGMPAEALEELIMNNFKKDHADENLGLYNLSRRLQMFFFDSADITINSFEDCGFETMITIPIIKGR